VFAPISERMDSMLITVTLALLGLSGKRCVCVVSAYLDGWYKPPCHTPAGTAGETSV